MSEFSLDNVGLKVGLEIHQQLATGRKLFCSCTPTESDNHTVEFRRKLRTSKSELGEHDPAALFEKSKSRTILYYGNHQNSCLVEQDEEPPHALDMGAKRISLVIASALKSNIFQEIYPMRKTVVDGSNTTGFQRTMLLSQGGYYNTDSRRIGIQSICLEEDAAKLLGDKDNMRCYSLERLGIPLVEIATEPFEVAPKEIREIAISLGRILRSTKNVIRGIGSIRQDVNVSIREGGTVVEVKGVQQLDQLEKVVTYEAKRQYGLLQISRELDGKLAEKPERINATDVTSSWNSSIIKKAVGLGHQIHLMIFADMAGIFGMEHISGIRLGRDLAEIAKSFGLGGIFHSDELPAYGISQDDVNNLKQKYGIRENDAFLLFAAPSSLSDVVTAQLFLRMTEIRDKGIPRDTRMATRAGETEFLRPRPGAARMYPETDIPPVIVSEEELAWASRNIPKSWGESVQDMQKKFKLNSQLAEQLLDSRYFELFEDIASNTVHSAFIASILCSSITRMERDGLDSKLLNREEITHAFELLNDGKIAKESVEMIFEDIMAGRSSTVQEAIKNTSVGIISGPDLEKIINDIVSKNIEIVNRQKERALGPIMGIAMKELRGRASGAEVNKIILNSIREKLQ